MLILPRAAAWLRGRLRVGQPAVTRAAPINVVINGGRAGGGEAEVIKWDSSN